ncbi:hypothetical protein Taro_032393, partial [Colocasia esculenta]|nr:hypothetical protein [Colocasia esculenta]
EKLCVSCSPGRFLLGHRPWWLAACVPGMASLAISLEGGAGRAVDAGKASTLERRSYAQVIAATKPPPALAIVMKPPSFTDDGEPEVFFTKEEVGKSIATLKLSIIVRWKLVQD